MLASFPKLYKVKLNGWQKTGLVIAYLGIFVLPAIYLVLAVRYFLQVHQQTLGGVLRRSWVRYRTQQPATRISIGLGTLLFLCSFVLFTSFAAGVDRQNILALTSVTPAPISPTPTTTNSTQAVVAPVTPTRAVPTSSPTKQPTPMAKPTPPPKPTPPVARPTPTPVPPLSLAFTCAQAVDYSYGRICVHTQPGAALTVTVVYCSGYKAVSGSLQGTQYADSGGNYEWAWTPETKCRGPATASVTASWQGQSASNSDSFTVQ